MSTGISGRSLATALIGSLPQHWDGKRCVQELKNADYNWRQMEWIGWWFEYRAMKVLASLGATQGPTFGSVTFDCSIGGIWDFKTHPRKARDSGYAYLNDEEAVDRCLRSHKHIGWLVAVGTAVYDESGEFKDWHDQLKGAESAYVREGRTMGRPSRLRKAGFELQEVAWIEFRSEEQLRLALQTRVLKRGLQKGQQNSDGSARRPKYGLSYARLRRYFVDPTAGVSAGSVPVA